MPKARTALLGSWLLPCFYMIAIFLSGGGSAHAAAEDVSQWVALPQRSKTALGGAAFIKSIAKANHAQRENAIFQQVRQGNVPSFMRQLVPVNFSQKLANGAPHTVTLFVSSDYLAIGSDNDYVRMPVSLPTAFRIVDELNLSLPTKRIVDLIHEHAACHLVPAPLPAGRQMTSNAYYMKHQHLIEGQVGQRSRPGALTSGHKKDLVVTKRLLSKRNRVAIYGWHRPSGRAIQPLSTVHEAAYADYSHGLRLISPLVIIDGRLLTLAAVLADPALAPLLSDEGPIAVEAIRTRCNNKLS